MPQLSAGQFPDAGRAGLGPQAPVISTGGGGGGKKSGGIGDLVKKLEPGGGGGGGGLGEVAEVAAV